MKLFKHNVICEKGLLIDLKIDSIRMCDIQNERTPRKLIS